MRLYTSRNGWVGRAAFPSWLYDRDCGSHPLRVGHRKVDIPRAETLGQLGHLSGQGHAGLGAARDLDVAPHELHATSDRLSHRLLAREAGVEVLSRVRPREAVAPLLLREHAVGEPGPLGEGGADTLNLDHVDPDPHAKHTTLRAVSRVLHRPPTARWWPSVLWQTTTLTLD